MLNEERIILMTKMASYEANEGKQNVAAGKYFRSDYITLQILKSIISSTLAYIIIFALFILYDFEVLMQEIYKMDLFSFIQTILIWYGVTSVVYGVISYIVYSFRYAKARKNLKRYYNNLKKLNAMYNN